MIQNKILKKMVELYCENPATSFEKIKDDEELLEKDRLLKDRQPGKNITEDLNRKVNMCTFF